jgi:hypothetical protein
MYTENTLNTCFCHLFTEQKTLKLSFLKVARLTELPTKVPDFPKIWIFLPPALS